MTSRGLPPIVEIQARTMVNQPDVVVPHQEIRIAPTAIDVADERVEPHQPRREFARDESPSPFDPECAGQEVHAEVQANTCLEKILDFLVGFVLGQLFVQPEAHHVGYPKTHGARQFSGDDLGREHRRPLAGTVKLRYVGAKVIRLDDAGQGTAFAQGRDVANDLDLRKHAGKSTDDGVDDRNSVCENLPKGEIVRTTVVSSHGGAVGGATVTLVDSAGRQVGMGQADHTGDVIVDTVPAGYVTAIVTAPGFRPSASFRYSDHKTWRVTLCPTVPPVRRRIVKKPVVVRAVDVSRAYGQGDSRVHALREVSIEFTRGQFTAIMGPSGSGKSTLMHCLAGLDTVDSGQVWIGDTDITQLNDAKLTDLRRDRIGFIFQQFNLLPTLTAEENMLLPLSIAGNAPSSQWFRQVVDTVGLSDRLKHRPTQLSGGQQQRVACARALLSRPEVIFADEPTGNLDSRSGQEVLAFLQRSARELGQTIVMVTHDPSAASYADRVVFLADGSIIGELRDPTADQVLETMKHIE